MRSLFFAAIVLFVSPAIAADTPEQVFAQYHRAMMKADIDTVLRLSTEAQQARMKIAPLKRGQDPFLQKGAGLFVHVGEPCASRV